MSNCEETLFILKLILGVESQDGKFKWFSSTFLARNSFHICILLIWLTQYCEFPWCTIYIVNSKYNDALEIIIWYYCVLCFGLFLILSNRKKIRIHFLKALFKYYRSSKAILYNKLNNCVIDQKILLSCLNFFYLF